MKERTTATLEILDWDSSFLGLRTARLSDGGRAMTSAEINRWLEEARRLDAELVYFSTEFRPRPLVLERAWTGDTPIEEKVTFEQKNLSEVEDEIAPDIREAQSSDEARIVELAILSGHLSRFRVDEEMDRRCTAEGQPSVADRLYSEWGRRSLSGELADVVYVCERDGEVRGMVAAAKVGPSVRMSIMGVDTSYAGQGIGKSLMRAVRTWAKREGAESLIIISQRKNEPACQLYRSMGARETQAELFYHFWRQ